MTELQNKKIQELYQMLKLMKFISIILLVGVFASIVIGIINMKNTKILVNDSYQAKQSYVLDTYDMTSNSNIPPENLQNNVSTSLMYCTDDNVVTYNNMDITPQCDEIKTYSQEHYS